MDDLGCFLSCYNYYHILPLLYFPENGDADAAWRKTRATNLKARSGVDLEKKKRSER